MPDEGIVIGVALLALVVVSVLIRWHQRRTAAECSRWDVMKAGVRAEADAAWQRLQRQPIVGYLDETGIHWLPAQKP